jgi:hypothetical protein
MAELALSTRIISIDLPVLFAISLKISTTFSIPKPSKPQKTFLYPLVVSFL